MSTIKPRKNELISYITKNYNEFKFFLKTLHKKKIITDQVFKYAIDLTPEGFKQETHKMPDKKYNMLAKIIKKRIELVNKMGKKKRGGKKPRTKNEKNHGYLSHHDGLRLPRAPLRLGDGRRRRTVDPAIERPQVFHPDDDELDNIVNADPTTDVDPVHLELFNENDNIPVNVNTPPIAVIGGVGFVASLVGAIGRDDLLPSAQHGMVVVAVAMIFFSGFLEQISRGAFFVQLRGNPSDSPPRGGNKKKGKTRKRRKKRTRRKKGGGDFKKHRTKKRRKTRRKKKTKRRKKRTRHR